MIPLAGPIVRRALPDGATVWLALDRQADVTLEVYDGDARVASGTASTVKALDDIHVVAVTASGQPLGWGRRYTYALAVDGQPVDLSTFALDGERPGFHLLSDRPETLRIVHGSCRKPHGEGADALELVEDLLREGNPPQALFLTGDQIYADDVDAGILKEIEARAIPDRAAYVKAAGFTSTAAANHLVEFAEFARMYVYTWSRSPKVRRVLANVATWMTFDDHDVTDDWNLDEAWTTNLKDDGRAIVDNALRAYALFQHWGNEPGRLPTGEGPWGWHFDTPLFRCVSLDTRTDRHYARPRARPGLMRPAEIDRVLAGHGKPFTLVISPAPVLGQKLVEGLQSLGRVLGNYAADQEPWSGDADVWRHLLDRMAALGRVLVLSGDVHFGFLARMTDEKASFEIVNATASAFKNESREARTLALLGGWSSAKALQSGALRVNGAPVVEEIAGEEGGVALQSTHRTTAIVAANHVGDLTFGGGLVRQRYVSKAGAVTHTARFLGEALALQALVPSGPVPAPAERLAERIAAGTPPDGRTLDDALAVLRSVNRFAEILDMVEVAAKAGHASGRVRLRQAQALIETKRLTDAVAVLRGIVPESDFVDVERTGLLGRAYKQLWIDARPNGVEPRRADLLEAIRCYEALPAPKHDPEWLDVNVMALRDAAGRLLDDAAHRAGAEDRARRLLATPPDPENPWALANRGEAALVLGQLDEARRWFETYLVHPRITAFHARGTMRQLAQIHGLRDDTEPGRTLLPRFQATILEKGGTGEPIDISPGRRALFAERPEQGPFRPLAFLRQGLDRARSVGRIELGGVGFGTCFLVDLSRARRGWERVLLTNAHVCSDPPAAPFARPPEEVRARFFADDGGSRVFRVRPLWSSPVAACDATVLEVVGDPGAPPLVPFLEMPSAQERVNVIGHPEGRDTQVSAQDNELAQLDERRLWYRAGTAAGSSGSPVFDDQWRLVGLHHARNNVLGLNEGIRLDHILKELS